MGDDDRRGDDGGVYGSGSADGEKIAAPADLSSRPPRRPNLRRLGGLFTMPYRELGGSTSSLGDNASSEGVIFVGDHARLELFPVDANGVAIPARPPRRVGTFAKLCNGVRKKITPDVVYASVLAVICIVILIVVIIDR
ncbi:m41 [Muromegalovirus G4]|uniref:M41 n=1 Tax=Muromegalovirus G4 TaxID=524650 RepID=B3UWZ6_MUHV1|nr:m41 [Muromegalovirus G4]QNL29189.1 m41 [Muromegalovirus G4]